MAPKLYLFFFPTLLSGLLGCFCLFVFNISSHLIKVLFILVIALFYHTSTRFATIISAFNLHGKITFFNTYLLLGFNTWSSNIKWRTWSVVKAGRSTCSDATSWDLINSYGETRIEFSTGSPRLLLSLNLWKRWCSQTIF